MDRNEQMQRLTEEYRNIQPPSGAYEQMQEAIRKGKREAVKRRRRLLVRNWSASVAAVFMLAVLLPNINADIAYAMEQLPVVGSFFKVVTIRNYHYEDEYHTADIDVPYLAMQSIEDTGAEVAYDMEEDTADTVGSGAYAKMYQTAEKDSAADQINASVEEYTQRLINQFETEMTESGESYLGLDVSYEVLVDNDDWFSLVIYAVETQASGYEFRKYYNIDKTKDAVVELGELFGEDTDYVTLISDIIREQMLQAMADDPDVVYFVEPDEFYEGFQGIKEDQNFYLNENGDLVIIFDEYEIAPGSMGCPEFVIAKEDIF